MSNVLRRATSVFALLLAGLVTGCTSVSSGDPRPASPSTAERGDGAERTSESPPERPREIRLDNIDPCTLLPRADYGDYFLDKPGKPGKTSRGAVECAWFGDVGYMDAALVTHEGVEARMDRNVEVGRTEPIEGFPAYTFEIPDSDAGICFVGVDVADGQYLDVQVGLYGDPEGVPPVCEYAHQFATSIMSTLVAS